MGKRRGKGEGSIFQRANGTWVARLDRGYDENGKRLRKDVYGKTKREVQEKLTRMQSDSLNGTLLETQRITVAEFMKRWLEDAARPSVRETTYVWYEGLIRLHIAPRIGGVQLAKLTPMHIQGLYSQLERAGASPRLRQKVHAVLHRALNQAMKWGYVTRNVCDAVDKPKVAKKDMQVLSPQEVGRFLEAARDDRLYAMYVLALTTGLRQGELLGLYWKDIDLKSGTIAVQASLIEVKGQVYRAEPKSAKGRRQVDIPEVATAALKEHRKRMLAEGHTATWVFCTRNGTPYRKSNLVQKSFRPILTRAELPQIRFHDLRHTAATLLLKEGVHPKIVQERLGHSQISLTLDTYSHVLPSMQKEAADKLDRLFGRLNAE